MPVCCSEGTSGLQHGCVLKTVVGQQQPIWCLVLQRSGSGILGFTVLRLNKIGGFPSAIGLHYWHTFSYADVVYSDR
jgi:hypothetical protein